MEIGALGNLTSLAADDGRKTSGGESFAEAMTRYLKEVNADQVGASQQMRDLVVRGEGTIHDTMVAMSDAEGSFRLMMEMRNRLVDGLNRLLTTQL